MAAIWSRHPRYALLLFGVLATTLYLLAPPPFPPPPPPFPRVPHIVDTSLSERIARADAIYDKVLKDRAGLIKKFGPNPSQVAMFPPDKAPWPAYTVWDFFPAAYNCPHEVQRIGALGDGGKWVCGLSRVQRKPDCVVYSIGINYESSFEADLLENTDYCEVWGYDFSVDDFGPQIPRSQRHRVHFAPYALGGEEKHGPNDQPKLYTLDALMRMNGHKHIDILKIDIEGWEFDTLTALIDGYVSSGRPLPFGQLQLEVHVWGKKFDEFLGWWEKLEAAGLRPFWTEPNLVYQNYNKQGNSDLAEYSFLNVRGSNIFTHDPAPVGPVGGRPGRKGAEFAGDGAGQREGVRIERD
ncbi:methyltransferase domain-containing protein [Schizophyllum commune]